MPEYLLPAAALSLTPAYLDATLAGDGREALRLTLENGLGAGFSARELQLRMIAPAQHEIGRLWQDNVITVAQEHLATSIAQLVISHLYPHLTRGPLNGSRILVACVEGELHDLGARMGADFLESSGFDVRFLAANVAASTLAQELADYRPHLLGLSATMHFHEPALRAAVATARSVSPDLPIFVGGGMLELAPGLARELQLAVLGSGSEDLADTCRRLTASPRPPSSALFLERT